MDRYYVNEVLFGNPPLTYSEETPGYINVGGCRRVAAFGVRLTKAQRVVVYCHGNGEDAYDASEILSSLLPQSVGLIVPAYAGFGLSEGVKSEAGCYEAASCAYEWAVRECGYKDDEIIIAGFSLGSGVAIRLASEKTAHSLVLFAPFYSGRTMLKNWVGDEKILGSADPFPSDRIICRVDTPTTIIHGALDDVIPISQGKRLFRVAGNSTAFHEVVAGHNDLLPKFGQDGFHSVFSIAN